ncbi:class II aldolase/adducin family protein [Limisalsivibrio acetivorans]|uniref:class II aldolase/adducin family protein n=1 Tax=Limisalsivibrio acetivorans TaxID=1304888 RepID=UPI00138AB351|nr:class II aldolase/adducin family protein [Limisalsivibrio acetivorans]
MDEARNDIVRFGRKLVERGMTTSFFGNLSAKYEDRLFITATGSMLDELEGDQVVEVPLHGEGENDSRASSELCVHRLIHQNVDCTSVMHAHTVYSILCGELFDSAASFAVAEVLPFLEYVPVVTGKSGSLDLAENVTEGLKRNRVIIVKDHGVFAAGETMKECYIYVSSLEFHAKELVLKRILNSSK